jgi:Na+/proline symporter
LYLKWGTGHGAFWSMLIGMAATLAWRFAVRFSAPGMEDVHEIIPAFCLSFVAYLAISRRTQRYRPPEEHLARVFGR